MKLTARHFTNKGFTLVELLVVIAILGVLAAGLITAIDPVDRINSANDARVQNDMGVIARAADAYAVAHNGYYPAGNYATAVGTTMVSSGDLKTSPIAPSGYTYTYTASPANCTLDGTGAGYCVSFVLTSNLRSKKYTAVPVQRIESPSGKTCQVATVNDACP